MLIGFELFNGDQAFISSVIRGKIAEFITYSIKYLGIIVLYASIISIKK